MARGEVRAQHRLDARVRVLAEGAHARGEVGDRDARARIAVERRLRAQSRIDAREEHLHRAGRTEASIVDEERVRAVRRRHACCAPSSWPRGPAGRRRRGRRRRRRSSDSCGGRSRATAGARRNRPPLFRKTVIGPHSSASTSSGMAVAGRGRRTSRTRRGRCRGGRACSRCRARTGHRRSGRAPSSRARDTLPGIGATAHEEVEVAVAVVVAERERARRGACARARRLRPRSRRALPATRACDHGGDRRALPARDAEQQPRARGVGKPEDRRQVRRGDRARLRLVTQPSAVVAEDTESAAATRRPRGGPRRRRGRCRTRSRPDRAARARWGAGTGAPSRRTPDPRAGDRRARRSHPRRASAAAALGAAPRKRPAGILPDLVLPVPPHAVDHRARPSRQVTSSVAESDAPIANAAS